MIVKHLNSTAPISRLKLKWIRNLHGLVRTPIYDPNNEERAFVVVYQEKFHLYAIVAFNIHSGEIYWQQEVINGGYGAPTIHKKQLVVLSSFTNIEAMDVDTGEILWQYETNKRVRSPLAVIDGLIVGSSGGEIFGVNSKGEKAFEISVPEAFFFGLCEKGGENEILSLGTHFEKSRGSILSLYAFAKDGTQNWRCDLGIGNVASSDTSGVLVVGDKAFVGSRDAIYAINLEDGSVAWETHGFGISCRHLLTSDGAAIYATTLDGHIGALDIESGDVIWDKYVADEGIWMPATIVGERVMVVGNGSLHCFDKKTGILIQEIAVGQSPYSACSVRGEMVLLGAGDPPYNGYLIGFEGITDEVKQRNDIFSCRLEKEHLEILPDEPVNITLTISGLPVDIKDLVMNLSSIGGAEVASPIQRFDNTFIFSVEPTDGRRWGKYALPVTITLENGEIKYSTVKLQISVEESLPGRFLIHDVPKITQEETNMSGAACMQAARELFGDKTHQQGEMRKMVDYIQDKSGYQSFDVWRLIARRALNTKATTVEELPEYE